MSDIPLTDVAAPGFLLEAALYCPDLDAAEAFYQGVIGLEKISRVDSRHVFFRVGTGVLLIFNPEETEMPARNPALPVPSHGARGPGHVCLAMPGEAMERWRKRLQAAGVVIEADFTWPNGARSIYFRDPAGNSVELAEPKLWA